MAFQRQWRLAHETFWIEKEESLTWHLLKDHCKQTQRPQRIPCIVPCIAWDCVWSCADHMAFCTIHAALRLSWHLVWFLSGTQRNLAFGISALCPIAEWFRDSKKKVANWLPTFCFRLKGNACVLVVWLGYGRVMYSL